MGWVPMAVMAVASVYQAVTAHKAASAQQDAQNQALQNQSQQSALQDQAINRANPKQPNTAAAQSAMQQGAKGGPSGTMLTGPSGVDPSTLSLGKSTLLGS